MLGGVFQVRLDLLEVRLADHGAQAVVRVQRVAQLPVLQVLGDQAQQLVLHILVHDQARRRGAVFAHVPERTGGDELGHFVQVFAVVHDHGRVLATQLQDDALEVGLGGILQEQPAGVGGTGEADHRDVHVPADGLAHFTATARHQVEHTGRDTGLMGQLGHAQGAEGGFLGRLDHDRATGGQRRGNLPGQHQQREVPRQHQADHADGLTHHHGHGRVAGRGSGVVDLVDQLGVPANRVDGFRHVDVLALADRLAAVQRFQHGQFVGVVFQQLGELQQHVLAVVRLHLRPGALFEHALGGGHGHVHVVDVAGGDFGQLLAGGRVGGDEGVARDGIAELTVDERLGTQLQFGGEGRVLLLAQQISHCVFPLTVLFQISPAMPPAAGSASVFPVPGPRT
ncbi:hypothetical protein D3C81_696210 [compost metagenome]